MGVSAVHAMQCLNKCICLIDITLTLKLSFGLVSQHRKLVAAARWGKLCGDSDNDAFIALEVEKMMNKLQEIRVFDIFVCKGIDISVICRFPFSAVMWMYITFGCESAGWHSIRTFCVRLNAINILMFVHVSGLCICTDASGEAFSTLKQQPVSQTLCDDILLIMNLTVLHTSNFPRQIDSNSNTYYGRMPFA